MKLYSININNVTSDNLKLWFNTMSNERKNEVSKIKIPKKQVLKIAADFLCRKAISEFCKIAPEEIVFGKSKFGKPFAVEIDIHFSISHSGDMVLCAVSEKEIGADIEKIRCIRLDAAKKFACENELKYINENPNGLFEIWTLKEAYFKCIGTGLGADIKKVCFTKTENGFECSEKGFLITCPEVCEGYICSVCEKD